MRELKGFNSKNKEQNEKRHEESKSSSAINDAFEKYSGMNENALIEQLVLQIKSSKENGTYDASQMKYYIQMLSPHLSANQKEKLDNVLRIIETEV